MSELGKRTTVLLPLAMWEKLAHDGAANDRNVSAQLRHELKTLWSAREPLADTFLPMQPETAAVESSALLNEDSLATEKASTPNSTEPPRTLLTAVERYVAAAKLSAAGQPWSHPKDGLIDSRLPTVQDFME